MISPSTPPGTKIVCINTDDILVQLGFTVTFIHTADALTLGGEYTVREIVPFSSNPLHTHLSHLFAVRVEEVLGCWDTRRFRRRDLPESLTRLTETSREPAGALA